MAAADGRIGRRGGEHRLRVEVDGAGNVPGLVGVARPAVDEAHAHSAPRGETASSSTSWSGKRARQGGRAGRRVVGPDDHGRAGAGERRAARALAGGRPAPPPGRRRPVGLVQAVVEPRREEVGVARRPRRPRAAPRGRRSPRRRRAGPSRKRAARGLGGRPLARDERDRRERERLGDARDAALPGERDPADERGGEVVGVALERRGRPRGAPRRGRRGARRRGRARSPRPTSRARARAGSGW